MWYIAVSWGRSPKLTAIYHILLSASVTIWHIYYSIPSAIIGVRAGGAGGGGGCSPSKILGDLDFLGSKRNLGNANYLRCFPAVFWIDRYFLFLPAVGTVKPDWVKFTRDSGCLARDELVISKGDHKLIYNYLFIFWHCTVLHCTSWCCKLIRINFGITF